MKNYKISVIVPLFDTNPDILAQCIESVLMQNYKNFELIIINDASRKYSTVAKANSYLKDNPCIRLVNLPLNKGLSNARNEGVRQSKGELIYYLDSDDYIFQGAFSRFNEIFNKWPNLDILSFHSKSLRIDGTFVKSDGNILKNYSQPTNIIKDYTITKDKPAPWAKVYSKNFIIENNLFFPDKHIYTEDFYYLIITYSKAKEIFFIMEAFHAYRSDVNTMSQDVLTIEKARDMFKATSLAYPIIKNDNNYISKNYKELFKLWFYEKIQDNLKWPHNITQEQLDVLFLEAKEFEKTIK